MAQNRIKQLRNSKKLTQDELGALCGFSGKAVGTWERGEREPSFEALQKMADYFEVTVDHLLGREVPDWASNEDVLDLEEMLNSNVNMSYGGENLTEEEKQRVNDILTGIFWEKLEKRKRSGANE